VPHGTAAYVCSPMDASFIVSGLLTIAGGIALRRFWPQRLHLLGALNIPAGYIAILLLSLSTAGQSAGSSLYLGTPRASVRQPE